MSTPREIAEKIVSKHAEDFQVVGQGELVEAITAALTRSEEEKNKSDTFREELRAKFNEIKDRYDLLQSSVSTLTARLKEAERLLIELHATVVGECPSLLNEDSGGDSRLALAIESFLTASTPVEKE